MDCTHLVVADAELDTISAPLLNALVLGVHIVAPSWAERWIARRATQDPTPLEADHLPSCKPGSLIQSPALLPCEGRRRVFSGMHIILPTDKLHRRLAVMLTMAGALAVHSLEEVPSDALVREWVKKDVAFCVDPDAAGTAGRRRGTPPDVQDDSVSSRVSAWKEAGLVMLDTTSVVRAIVLVDFSLSQHKSLAAALNNASSPPAKKAKVSPVREFVPSSSANKKANDVGSSSPSLLVQIGSDVVSSASAKLEDNCSSQSAGRHNFKAFRRRKAASSHSVEGEEVKFVPMVISSELAPVAVVPSPVDRKDDMIKVKKKKK